MESLALVVAILIFIGLFSGPISILLTSKLVKGFFSDSDHLGKIILNIIRQGVVLIIIVFGTFVGAQFLLTSNLPLIPRLIGLYSLITCYIGLRREFFPGFFILRNLLRKLGLDTRWGRSSGNDGHGPEGQH